MEIWREIAGYESSYEVSSRGGVRSLARIVRRGAGTLRVNARLLKPAPFPNGYVFVTLCRDGEKNCHLVHRLVAEAFVENPDAKPEVNHKNGIRDDNWCDNLVWVTRAENIQHSYDELDRKQHALTTAVSIFKYGESKSFPSILATSKFLRVNPGTVSSALHKGHLCHGWRVAA